MTYLSFKDLSKGKTANFLTKQSDLKKKPLAGGFFGFFLSRVFWVGFFGQVFNANPAQ
jgi:hypothetical protein